MKDSQTMHALLIDDSYRVEKVLANGACGLTELVTIEGEGPFVRKKIPRELARRRVWSILAECESPRLPCVELSYELPDCFVVVYDFIPGESLEHMVERLGSIEPEQAMLYISQVCEAAQVLHAHQVVHRDITPGNIVISADGAHLVDFGIARIKTTDAVRDTASLGTWGFASPEQFGFAQSDARSDVYSLGRVLGSVITGLRPDDEGYETALNDEEKLPIGLKRVIDKACAFEPSMRFQSASELGDALGNLLSGQGFGGEDSNECESRNSDVGVSGGIGAAQGLTGSAVERAESHSSSFGKSGVASPVVDTHKLPKKRTAIVAFGIAGALMVGGLCAVGLQACDPSAARWFSLGGQAATQPVSNSDGAQSEQFESGDEANGGVAASEETPTKQESLLKVKEYGVSKAGDGYVKYVFALENFSDDYSVHLPSVRVIARDTQGKVLFSDELVGSVVNNGQTVHMTGLAECDELPSTMSFEFIDSDAVEFLKGRASSQYEAKNVSVRRDDSGETYFTGEIGSVGSAGSLDGDTDQVLVTVVLRDKKGNIIDYQDEYLSKSSSGKVTSFDTSSSSTSTKFATYDVYVNAW